MVSESAIQKDIINVLKLHGAIIFRMNAGKLRHNVSMAPAGTPDIFAVLPYGTLWIEVKTSKGKLRPAQKLMIKDLCERNQEVIVARNAADVIYTLEVMRCTTPTY